MKLEERKWVQNLFALADALNEVRSGRADPEQHPLLKDIWPMVRVVGVAVIIFTIFLIAKALGL